MARRFRLTWDKANRSWLKYANGKRHYLGQAKGKYDADGYRRALARWEEIQAGQSVEDVTEPKGTRKLSKREYTALLKRFGDTSVRYPRRSLAWVATEYLKWNELRVEEGRVSYGYLRSNRWALSIFVKEFMGPKKAVIGYVDQQLSGISTPRLRGFRKWCTRQKNEGRFADSTINDLFSAVRIMTKWAVANSYLKAMPGGFEMHLLPLGKASRGRRRNEDTYIPSLSSLHEVMSFYRDQALVGENYNALQMFAYMVAMLNIGGTPIDLSYLTVDEWEDAKEHGNHLFLYRTKTGVPGNFQLWPQTVELIDYIKASNWSDPIVMRSPYHNDDEVELLLQTPRRRCLSIGAAEGRPKLSAYNAVTAKWYQDRTKHKEGRSEEWGKFSMKHLRKIGADRIAQHTELVNRLEIVSLYLRHSHQTTASKHYVNRHHDILDPVIEQLFIDLELEEIVTPVLDRLRVGDIVNYPRSRKA